MTKSWFLLCVIAVVCGTLLAMVLVGVAVQFAYKWEWLSPGDPGIRMGAGGLVWLAALGGPIVLAVRLKVGFWWGVAGLLLCFAAFAMFMVPAFYAGWGWIWALVGPVVYLALFGILYLKR